MRKVAVVTDSTCCLPAELVTKHSIHVVPLLICIGGKAFRDNVDITAKEVYTIMRRDEDLPTTSVPTPDDFFKTYIQLSKEAESLVCITLT
jgi:DegV family protein with EDD domain